jgi:hypothetical protein
VVLSHYEARLAAVLGGRLAAPFAGRVFVAPGPDNEPELPALLVSVPSGEILSADFGASRPQVVPGANDPRRVLRMRCAVRIEAHAATRTERMAALDAVLYELDAPDLRDATALEAPGDPGFQLSGQAPVSVHTEPNGGPTGEPAGVLLTAEGWFWPPNAPGVTGAPITATPLRAALLPVALEPWPLHLRAGDAPTPLLLRLGGAASVDEIALRLAQGAAGQLAGGTAGPDNARIVPLADDSAAFQYVPPAAPATDHLVVAMDGIELARFELAVRP